MFSSLRQRLILGIYIFIILSIPLSAYFLSDTATSSKQPSAPNIEEPSVFTSQSKPVTSSPSPSPARVTLNVPTPTPLFEEISPSPSTAETGSEVVATSFGPTLSLKVKLEGRPEGNQSTRLFVGIVEGTISTNPTFLLSFTVDLPASGEYSNLSLAGLTSGSTYTTLLKSSSQIATSSAFLMTPTISSLNSSDAITLLSGDLNEDNVVNSADYSIAQSALGTTSSDSNWNAIADINKDGIVNTLDIGYIIKNFGKVGESGAWTSPIPTPSPSASAAGGTGSIESSPSATTLPIGSTSGSKKGYWIWVPN